jgi:hypothetical protein
MRRMTTYAVMAGLYLADAAPDTAGDVGAVHHDISPEACGINRSGLWFFLRRVASGQICNRAWRHAASAASCFPRLP